MPSKPSKSKAVRKGNPTLVRAAAPESAITPSETVRTDVWQWPNEQQVAGPTCCSVRSVRRLAVGKKIERQERAVPDRRPEARFNPLDVERLALEKPFLVANGLHHNVSADNKLQNDRTLPPALTHALALMPAGCPIFEQTRETLAKLMRKMLPAGPQTQPAPSRLWAGTAHLGLTKARVRALVRSGELQC
jgi:hypothetical protein